MISIVIPVYNSEKTIKKCIKSLLNQTLKNYEIIAVDDESIDKSYKILKSIAKKNKRISAFKIKHSGPAKARNFGAKMANYDILIFVDADCVAKNDFLEKIIEPFKNKRIVGVQGAYKTKQKSFVARFVQFEIENRYKKMKKRKYIDFIGSYACAYRKKNFFEVGGFDENFPIASGEDPALSFKLSKAGYKMVFKPDAIVYHKHPETISAYLKQKFYRAYWRVLLYKKFPEKIANESYTPNILKLQVFLLFASMPVFFLNMYIAFSIILISLLLNINLTLDFFRKNGIRGITILFLLFLRNIVFVLGLLFGLFSLFIRGLR